MEMLALTHQGVPCVVPSASVHGIHGVPSGEPSHLFGDVGHEDGAETRYVHLVTPRGARSVGARDVRIVHVDDGDVHDLPPLVRAVLSMPHVEALVELDGGIGWLVDPAALEAQ